MAGRDTKGRFAPGHHPDRGRGPPPGRRTRQSVLPPAQLYRAVIEVANHPVSIAVGRGRRVVTLFEALVRKLGSDKVTHRLATKRFIELTIEAARASYQMQDSDGGAAPPAASPFTSLYPIDAGSPEALEMVRQTVALAAGGATR